MAPKPHSGDHSQSSPRSRELAALAEAYTLVSEGFERALRVPGLPAEEVESLRVFLRWCHLISQQPALALVSAPPSPAPKSQPDA